jgi:hypothetical protein
MPTVEFLKEVELSYTDAALELLEGIALDIYDKLIYETLPDDEEVDDQMWEYLALQVLIAKRRTSEAIDIWQRAAAAKLCDQYTSIFRNPDDTSQHIFTYAMDQAEYAAGLGNNYLENRWQAIADASFRGRH